MRRAPLLTLLLLPLALACTTVTDDMANPQVREPALETPIMVSKSDLARAAANFEVRAIELLPGETPEQALARVVGPAAPSLGALLDSAAPVEGLGPAPEAAEAPALAAIPHSWESSSKPSGTHPAHLLTRKPGSS